MEEIQNPKRYDLEERTFLFAKECRSFIKKTKKTIGNIEDAKQLARSSGSVAANYIEANEAVSKADFTFRIKVCRKEAKESRLWLRLIDTDDSEELYQIRQKQIQESLELTKIFGAILEKSK